MYANIYRDLDSGAWATLNPSTCPCSGGWLLSDYDSYHKCPVHNIGQPHPEMDYDDDDYDRMPDGRPLPPEPTVDYRRMVNVNAYRTFRGQVARFLNITDTDADARIAEGLPADDTSPRAWIDSADRLSSALHEARLEEQAHAAGFSCRLEAAWVTAGEAEVNACRMGMSHEAAEKEGLRASQEWY